MRSSTTGDPGGGIGRRGGFRIEHIQTFILNRLLPIDKALEQAGTARTKVYCEVI